MHAGGIDFMPPLIFMHVEGFEESITMYNAHWWVEFRVEFELPRSSLCMSRLTVLEELVTVYNAHWDPSRVPSHRLKSRTVYDAH